MDALPLALGAGMLAAVNPCGFALLPAYLGIFVLDDRPGRTAALGRALRATAAMTLGFAAVFALFGLAIMPVASSVLGYLPWFTVVLGVALALAGAWVATGRSLPRLPVPRVRQVRRSSRPVTDSFASMAGFGASYAVASLGCTIAPFLAVVVTAFQAGSSLEGGLLFLAYAAGMGLVVGAAAVAVALARTGLIDRVRRTGSVLPRVAGAVLLGGRPLRRLVRLVGAAGAPCRCRQRPGGRRRRRHPAVAGHDRVTPGLAGLRRGHRGAAVARAVPAAGSGLIAADWARPGQARVPSQVVAAYSAT